MNWKSAVLAVVGAALGAGLWWLAAAGTGKDYIFGTVAIGFLCGIGSMMAGGDGPVNGGYCALVTLVVGSFARRPFYGDFDGMIEATGGMGVIGVMISLGVAFWLGEKGKQ